MRLTDLHDAAVAALERASRYTKYMPKLGAETEAAALDAEIRARVAAQEVPFRWAVDNDAMGLLYGVSDAERKYPRKRVVWGHDFPKEHWAHHERHAAPVGGCHLCRMELAGLAGGGPF